MKSRIIQLSLLVGVTVILSVVSCTRTEVEEYRPERDYVYNVHEESVIPGVMAIRLKEEPSGPEEVLEMFNGLPVVSAERLFKGPEKFEARKRKMGLTKWYVISYDESMPLTRAAIELGSIEGVDIAEYMPRIKMNDNSPLPFDDPMLFKQWHYYNDGSQMNSEAGSDINLLKAWEVTTGAPDVIVAIIDGGIDYTHEDLAANMWINQAEANGEPGVDDDGNGYVDDIYGYNFCVRTGQNAPIGTISFNDHGTHVAGTVAAVNNNGIGVGGVAGGDGSGNGVRLMSCQTNDNDKNPAYIATAFGYAADNGAVIAQCSWGCSDTYTAVLEAIDYFVMYAGMDTDPETGDIIGQTGPMAGGTVIFAAGNSSSSTQDIFPANYEEVIAVASIGADYETAYYTNYGEWVDVTAPGGDAKKNRNVISTLPGNQYGGMQGTSMACPHVSGVAALVVSVNKGMGFTADHLRTILVKGTDDIIYEYNPTFTGMLGSGLIDANKCVRMFSPEPPEPVEKMEIEFTANVAEIRMIVPKDPDSGVPEIIRCYFSTSPIDGSLYGVDSLDVQVGNSKAGDTVSGRTPFLKFNTTYYFRAVAIDMIGSRSMLSEQYSAKSGENLPPVIDPIQGAPFVVSRSAIETITITATDPESNPMTATLSASSDELRLSQKDGNTFLLTITGAFAPDADVAKDYSVEVIVSDGYLQSSVTIPYTILPNNPPVIVTPIPDQFMNSGESIELILSDYIADQDEGDVLIYTVTSSATDKVQALVSGTSLIIKGVQPGTSEISVRATDYSGKSVTTAFNASVRDSSRPFDLYPVPVKDVLNVRSGSETDIRVSVFSVSGARVLESANVAVSIQSPYQLDMSALPGGTYTVEITYSEEGASRKYKKQIVKL